MTTMLARPMAAGSSGSVAITMHVASVSEPISANAVYDTESETRTGGGQRMYA